MENKNLKTHLKLITHMFGQESHSSESWTEKQTNLKQNKLKQNWCMKFPSDVSSKIIK